MRNEYWRFRNFFAEGSRKDEMRRAVLSNEVYCPAPSGFNDPFDVNPVIEFSEVSIEAQIERVKRQIARNNPPTDVARLALDRASQGYMNSAEYHRECRQSFLEEIRGTQVLSLFSDVENPAMWAYYGGNGSGYAIGIDFNQPLSNGEYPLPVNYSDERPCVDFNEDMVEDSRARTSFLQHCFLTKATVWDKEAEFRLIFPDCVPGYRNLGDGKVSSICLGFNPDRTLLDAVSDLRRRADVSVRFLQIKLCKRTYELRVVPVG